MALKSECWAVSLLQSRWTLQVLSHLSCSVAPDEPATGCRWFLSSLKSDCKFAVTIVLINRETDFKYFQYVSCQMHTFKRMVTSKPYPHPSHSAFRWLWSPTTAGPVTPALKLVWFWNCFPKWGRHRLRITRDDAFHHPFRIFPLNN